MDKFGHLEQALRKMRRVLVAFSGGVDSSLLLRTALDVLGPDKVLAVICRSDSYPASELAAAEQLARTLGARFQVIQGGEFDDPRFVANSKDRCYFCKLDLFSQMEVIRKAEGLQAILDGNNADDAGDWRPGRRAAREHGVFSPLMDAGITKAEIRRRARELGLPNWNKPSMACLASRIPYGTSITPGALRSIGAAEAFLNAEGFAQVRVRHHGEIARIEVAAADIPRLLDDARRTRVTDRIKALGFNYVALDLQGYRTGSMNEVLDARDPDAPKRKGAMRRPAPKTPRNTRPAPKAGKRPRS